MRRVALSQSNPCKQQKSLLGAVSSCGHDASLEEKFASWIDQQDRPFPSHEWLEDCSRGRCDEMSQWAILVTGPPGTGRTASVRLLARTCREESSWSVTCEKWKNANSRN